MSEIHCPGCRHEGSGDPEAVCPGLPDYDTLVSRLAAFAEFVISTYEDDGFEGMRTRDSAMLEQARAALAQVPSELRGKS